MSSKNISLEFLKNVTDVLNSYRIRAFIEGKEDILDSKIYDEDEYYQILFKMFDEEKLKYSLYDFLKQQENNDLGSIKSFCKKNNLSFLKGLAFLELLHQENLVNIIKQYDEIKEQGQQNSIKKLKDYSIKAFKGEFTNIKSVYEPVKVIFNSNICSGCGLCAGICPVNCISIKNGFGEIDDDKCIRCGLCYYICPRTYLPVSILNMYQDDASEINDYGSIGEYNEAYCARTTVDQIKQVCQDGGVSSTCLYYLLENNKIDLALGAKMGDQLWCPEPFLVKTKEDIIKTAGTKYVNNPNLMLLNKIDHSKKIAVVGVPCMMQALLKSEIYDIDIPSLNNIEYRIGIFCMESFPYDEGFLKICEKLEVDVNNIKKTDINKGKFFIYTNNGEELNVPIKEVSSLAREDCEVCFDLTSESADISIGSIGAPSGWNTILIRTEKGKELYDALLDHDLIESKPIEQVKPGLPLLKKIAKGKRKKSKRHISEKLEKNKRIPSY